MVNLHVLSTCHSLQVEGMWQALNLDGRNSGKKWPQMDFFIGFIHPIRLKLQVPSQDKMSAEVKTEIRNFKIYPTHCRIL